MFNVKQGYPIKKALYLPKYCISSPNLQGMFMAIVTVVLGDTSILLLNQHIKTHKVPKDVY